MSEPKMAQEDQDAERVEQAIELLLSGNLATAEAILRSVAANTPPNYVFADEDASGALQMRFWDQEDFLYYVTRHQEEIKQKLYWTPNAYGKAHYYLGFLEVKRGRDREAIQYLDAGLRLEPDQATFHLEKGKVLITLREFEAALDSYETVLARGLDVPPRPRAVAYRGKGFIMIELGDLDAAERYFQQSLTIEPDNHVAHNELQYIAKLRRGGSRNQTQTVQNGGVKTPTTCSLCGSQSLDKGSIYNVEGNLIYLCANCKQAMQARTPKKWWQFWKK